MGRAVPGSTMGVNRVPNARGAAAGRLAGFLGQGMGPKNKAREALGDRAASQGGMLNALLNELFVFG